MSTLFETTEINGMKLVNRFVRSATWEGMAETDGSCTSRLVGLMSQLAEGGVGLIITSHAYIRSDGQASPWQLGISKDEFISGLEKMTQAVHKFESRIVIQITHGGLFSNAELTGQSLSAPSAVEGFTKSPPKEMTVADIRKIVKAFGQAANRAKKAGFDGVQIHSAHGYLLNQFLSPAFNKRKDAYGGPVENRAKAHLETLGEVRAAVGPDFPILFKLNTDDFLDGGLILEDSLQAGIMLEERGIDALELSGGTALSGELIPSRLRITSEEKEAYFEDAARAFKKKLSVPIIMVGGIRSFPVAERVVAEGIADYISVSRPLIREPALVKRWASGDLRKATCISDSRCRERARAGEGLYCVVEKERKD